MKKFLLSFVLMYIAVGCVEKETYKLMPWASGQWVQYEAKQEGSSAPISLKFSLVGKEEIEQADYYWFEMESASSEKTLILKMLIPEKFQGEAVRIIAQVDDNPAIEISPEMTGQTSLDYHPTLLDEKEVMENKVGIETLSTKAGEFTCIHSTIKDEETASGEIWVSSRIPILGIVRSVTSSETWELVSYGETGGSSAIKEKVHTFNPEELLEKTPEKE